MWNGYLLKQNARSILKNNYFKSLLAVFSVIIISNGLNRLFFRNANLESMGEFQTSGAMTEEMFKRIYEAIVSNWELVIGIYLMILAVNFFITIFAVNPLTVGRCRFFNGLATNQSSLKNVFFAFTNGSQTYFNIVKVGFFKVLFLTLWALLGVFISVLFMAGFGVGLYFMSSFVNANIVYYLLSVLQTVVFVVSFIPLVIKIFEYYMVEYILSDEPLMDWKSAIRLSKRLMKGEKVKAIFLSVSFIGWMFAGALLLGIGHLFVLPYIYTTFSQLYLCLKHHKYEVANEKNEN